MSSYESRYPDLVRKYHKYLGIQDRELPIPILHAEMRQCTVSLFPDATIRSEEDITMQIAQVQGYLDRVATIRTDSMAMRDLWRVLREELEAEIAARIDFIFTTRPDVRNMTPDSVRKAFARREVAGETSELLRKVTQEEERMSTFDKQVALRMERLQGTYEALSRQVTLIEIVRRREFVRFSQNQGLNQSATAR